MRLGRTDEQNIGRDSGVRQRLIYTTKVLDHAREINLFVDSGWLMSGFFSSESTPVCVVHFLCARRAAAEITEVPKT